MRGPGSQLASSQHSASQYAFAVLKDGVYAVVSLCTYGCLVAPVEALHPQRRQRGTCPLYVMSFCKSCDAPCCCCLADRLDKSLTIGQMQGKFQLVLMPTAGHAIQVGGAQWQWVTAT